MAAENALTRRELLSCLELGKALTSELEPSQLYQSVLKKVSDLLPAANWSLLLVDEESETLRFELCVGMDLDVVKDVRLRIGEGVAGQTALQKKPIVVEDVSRCHFFYNRVDQLSNCVTRSIICVPLIFGGEVLGVIEVVNPADTGRKALDLLAVIADYAAIAVENMNRYRAIQSLAIHDGLTGLYNTRYLYEALSRLTGPTRETGRPVSLIFMDLDNFKNVVDTLGHLKGSRALQEVAKTIKACIAEPQFAVAYGGDEFVVVLPDCEKRLAQQKAEEIRREMNQTAYLSDYGHSVAIRASFGVATFPDDSSDSTGLIGLADKAMFEVKVKGKNAVKCAEQKTPSSAPAGPGTTDIDILLV